MFQLPTMKRYCFRHQNQLFQYLSFCFPSIGIQLIGAITLLSVAVTMDFPSIGIQLIGAITLLSVAVTMDLVLQSGF
jgi:hypothetical protein